MKRPTKPPSTVIAVRVDMKLAAAIRRLAEREDRTASNWCAGKLREAVATKGTIP